MDVDGVCRLGVNFWWQKWIEWSDDENFLGAGIKQIGSAIISVRFDCHHPTIA